MRRKKRNKYGAIKTKVDGITFDSKKEARRYCELSLMQKAGEISNLQCHPRYRLEVNGYLICHYTADFCYSYEGKLVVEDVKGGVLTRDFRLRKKLMWAIHGIEVIIT